jgi:uncharacterized protein (TIGR00251 family)
LAAGSPTELSELVRRFQQNGTIVLDLKVSPRASKTEVVGFSEGTLKVKLAAMPEKGKANEELRSLLGSIFAVPKSRIEIVAGRTSAHKRIKVSS